MNLPRPSCILAALLSVFALLAPAARLPAQNDSSSKTEDGWVEKRDEQTGLLVMTRELTLHPRPEPDPALEHRLLPDRFDMLPGNAAIYYLKVLGFLEQDPARERLYQYLKEALAKAQEEGGDASQARPYVWLSMPPDELPLKEVKEYLQLMSFQPPMLREAARRDRFDMDRNFRQVDDPIAYLLPEIQVMRELSRTQSLRCRVAIAEGRVEDAMAITGQQFALARHLGQDDFLISNLVGIAIASIAWNDALYLVQHPKTPNLYWALASLPSPLVDTSHSMATERQFLYQQLKVLREVDETPRPAGYWQEFIDRQVSQMGMLASEFHLPSADNDPQLARAAVVAYVAAAYPGARDYLIQRQQMSPEQVDAYPTAQVVFLAVVRFHNHWRDEYFKWMHLPVWQVRSKSPPDQTAKSLRAEADRYGWCSAPTMLLLPAVQAAKTAEARCMQTIALLETVEGVRMYAAAHNGKLPPSLAALPVPAPVDPFTGQPIDYEVLGDRAVLNGHSLPGLRYRLVLRVAP